MPKRNAQLSIIYMIIDIHKQTKWQLMISKNCIYIRVTKKAMKTMNLMNLVDEAQKYDVIGIDEGQFFKEIV